jgi:hypothetical protein
MGPTARLNRVINAPAYVAAALLLACVIAVCDLAELL